MPFARIRAALRNLLGLVPTLDLHGCGVREAREITAAFLGDAQAHGERIVRIVYGKGRNSPGGRGVLREVVPRWLDGAAALVEHYERLPDPDGADGAVRVWVRPLPSGRVDSPAGLP